MAKPLSGRTVIITRPRVASRELVKALTRAGAKVVVAPLIKIVPPKSWKSLDRAIKRVPTFDVIIFTSHNAVEYFFNRMKVVQQHRTAPPSIVAAVGSSTANSVSVRGWTATTVPEDARAVGLLRVLRVPRGASVLIPRAERGSSLIARSLRKQDARVTVVHAYRTLPDEDGRRLLRSSLARGADAVLFASGSAASAGASDTRLSGAAAVAIGPSTAAVLRERGLAPFISRSPAPKDFAKAAIAALRGRP